MDIDLSKCVIKFNYSDATVIETVKRNLNYLYSTPVGSCPLDRDYGISQEFISYPAEVAKNMLAQEVIEKTAIYEPGIEVIEVTYEVDKENVLLPIINIGKGG